MKISKLIAFAASALVISQFAYGSFQPSFATVNGTFYDLNAATANADYQGADLGTFDTDLSEQILLGGELNVTGGNVQFANLNYAIFEDDGVTEVVAFTFIGATFDSVQSGNDRWTIVGGARPDLISTHSLASGDYQLHINITGDYNPGGFGFTEDNGGSNYVANFTVVPEPGTFALLSGFFALTLIALKRRRES